jgi:hypothetical protein
MKKNSFYSFLLIVLLTACAGPDDRLSIKNTSNGKIYVEFSSDSNYYTIDEKLRSLYSEDTYDTMKNAFLIPIKAKESYRIKLTQKEGWEKMAYRSETDKIYFFIAKDSIVNEYGSKLVLKHHLCEREGYTLDELKKLNWVVTYPRK